MDSKKERLPVAKSKSGLSGRKVKLDGNNKSEKSRRSSGGGSSKNSSSDAHRSSRRPSHGSKVDAEEDLLRSLARGDASSFGGGSMPSRASTGGNRSRGGASTSRGRGSLASRHVQSDDSDSSSESGFGSGSGSDSDSDSGSDSGSSSSSMVSEAGTFISMSSSGSSSSDAPARKAKKPAANRNPFGMADAEVEEAEKQDILARMHTMKMKGVRLSKNYTPRSSLNELRMEIGRIEHEHELNRSIQRLRRYLMMLVAGAEKLLNIKQMPNAVRGRLNGYSDYVLNSIEEYDPAFERLSEKYGGVVGLGSTGNPLLDIALLIGMQMVMFIFIEGGGFGNKATKPLSPTEIKDQYPTVIKEEAERLAQEMMRSKEAELKQQKEDTERAKREWEQRMMQQAQGQRTTFRAPRRQPIPMPAAPVPNAQPDIAHLEHLLPPPGPLQRSTAIPPPDLMPADSPPRRTPLSLAAPLTPARPNTPRKAAVTPRSAGSRASRTSRVSARSTGKASTPGKTLDLNAGVLEENPAEIDVPFFEGSGFENDPKSSILPQTPAARTKLIEMPDNARSTRKGRTVKVNSMPAKSALKKPTEIDM